MNVGGRLVPGSALSNFIFKLRIILRFRDLLTLDVVDAQYPVADGLPLMLLKLGGNRPAIVLRSVGKPLPNQIGLYLNYGGRSRIGFLLRKMSFRIRFALNDLVLRHADAGSYESLFMARRMRNLESPLLRPVQLGIDTSRYSWRAETDILRTFGILGKKYAIFVGALEERKGAHVFVEAMLPLIREGILDKALIIGKERAHGYEAYLRKVIGEEASSFILANTLAPLELIHLYSECALFVSCSMDDSFGYPIVEAVACGAPVVSTNVGVSYEIGLTPPIGIVGGFSAAETEEEARKILSGANTTALRAARRQLVFPRFDLESWGRRLVDHYVQTIRSRYRQ